MAKKPAFPSRPCPKCGEPIHIKSKRHEVCGWVADGAVATDSNSTAEQNGEKTGSYFRRVFRENPTWLKGRSNADVLDRWLADHPGHTEVPKNIQQHLSNVKSTMRSKKRKKRAEAKEAAASAVAVPMGMVTLAAPAVKKPARNKLHDLEIQIDDCYIAARQLAQEGGLDDVVQHLRSARNAVVWKMGK